MPNHIRLELNLLENSFDYLTASLEYIAKARKDQTKVSWKFAILNLIFAIELLLKERIRRENNLLIYADLEKYKEINRETKTVSWTVLLERLKFVIGSEFDQLNAGRLRLAQKLRNQMLHYDVQLDFPAVYHDFANLLNFYTRFFNTEISLGGEDTLHYHVPDALWQQNDDLSRAFLHEIVYYNGVFMRIEQRDDIIAEQDRKTLLIDGKIFQRVPFTDLIISMVGRLPPDHSELICHDCLVYPGQIHLLGCDLETCPCCGRQLIFCGCQYQYPDEE